MVTGLPISNGRHGGCRLRFATDGTLHIGTGDAAVGTNAQSLTSLGGKTLRVRADGTVPPDNPFAARGGRTALIWTYDEHGGYYDHVPPPPAVRPDDIPPDIDVPPSTAAIAW